MVLLISDIRSQFHLALQPTLTSQYCTLFQVRNLVARRRHGDTHEPAGDIGGVEEESQRGNFDRGERSVLAPQRMHFRERGFAARFQGKRDYFVVSQLTKWWIQRLCTTTYINIRFYLTIDLTSPFESDHVILGEEVRPLRNPPLQARLVHALPDVLLDVVDRLLERLRHCLSVTEDFVH